MEKIEGRFGSTCRDFWLTTNKLNAFYRDWYKLTRIRVMVRQSKNSSYLRIFVDLFHMKDKKSQTICVGTDQWISKIIQSFGGQCCICSEYVGRYIHCKKFFSGKCKWIHANFSEPLGTNSTKSCQWGSPEPYSQHESEWVSAEVKMSPLSVSAADKPTWVKQAFILFVCRL